VTEPQGFAESVSRFSAELDAAVVRARHAASEARETSAKFRRETRQLAESVRSGTGKVTAADLTSDPLRRAAAGFRGDHGLPVEKLPSGPELLAPPPPAPPAPVTPGPPATTGSGRRTPRPSDDDEDFSQQRIMW
jgi:hypothetical protein